MRPAARWSETSLRTRGNGEALCTAVTIRADGRPQRAISPDVEAPGTAIDMQGRVVPLHIDERRAPQDRRRHRPGSRALFDLRQGVLSHPVAILRNGPKGGPETTARQRK